LNTLRGWAGAAHPFPLARVLLLTALIAVASARDALDVSLFGLTLAAMLLSQLAIGWSNDYLDRHLDAMHQPSKPVPSGAVDARWMPPAIALVLVLAATAGALLGAIPLLLLAIGTSCGLAYNLGLKRSRYSAATFLLAFTVLPPYVWTSLDVYEGDFLALYPIGMLLPVAVHVANVLPDLQSDLAQGRRTIAVVLGRERAVVLTMGCALAALVFTALSLPLLDYDLTVLLPVLAAYVALVLATGSLYLFGRSRETDAWAFRTLVLAAVLFAAGWLASV
jgi:4-hydroxybenzoate polyprenyltransferase